jgi:hypothetical protein
LAILHKDLRDLLEMQNEADARTEKLGAAGGPRFRNPPRIASGEERRAGRIVQFG